MSNPTKCPASGRVYNSDGSNPGLVLARAAVCRDSDGPEGVIAQ
jgi:hypothetical protein